MLNGMLQGATKSGTLKININYPSGVSSFTMDMVHMVDYGGVDVSFLFCFLFLTEL